MRIHERITYSCPYCQKSFSDERYCQKHISTCALSSPVECGKCYKIFQNNTSLTAHMKIHAENECSFCNKIFKSKQAMQEHKGHVHIKLTDKYCQFCKKIFETKFTLMRHMKQIHKSDDVTKGHCTLPDGGSIYIVSNKISEILIPSNGPNEDSSGRKKPNEHFASFRTGR